MEDFFLLRDLRCLSDSLILFCLKEDVVMTGMKEKVFKNSCGKISYTVCGTWKKMEENRQN